MKAALGLGLALLASIGVADTATARGLDPRPGSQQESQAQNGFSEVELKVHGLHARSHHTVVVELSHPESAPHPTNPDGTPGRHTIPYEFPRTRVYRFCMQDADGRRHRMVLTDAAGDHVLTVTAGDECVTVRIPAGQYTATLHHDGSGTPSEVNTVFIRPLVEPVDASVLASLTGGAPTDQADEFPFLSNECASTDADLVCCSQVDTWALASDGFYVTVNNLWNNNCANPDIAVDCPALLSTLPSGGPPPGSHPGPRIYRGVVSPGPNEVFDVYTCRLRGGTGPQFPRGTIFLSAPHGQFQRNRTGGFLFVGPSVQEYAGALVPGDGGTPDDVLGIHVKPGIDVGGSDPDGRCAQPLHLTHYVDDRISLSATLEESRWCVGGPLSAPPWYYVIEDYRRYLTFYNSFDHPLPNVQLQDAAFFTVNRADSAILIGTRSCSDCNLAGANLAGYNLTGVNLSRANLAGRNTNLSGVNLSLANLNGATLSFAYMPDADLTGADLTGAHLNNVDFYQRAKRPSLNGATLTGAQFANANLIGIDLSKAFLEGADFSGAQLLGALLKDIKHITTPTSGQVSFVKALLAGADFSNSTFDGGDFTNAIFSTKPGSVDLTVVDSPATVTQPSTTVTQPYSFLPTVRPLSTSSATICPNASRGPCADGKWVAQAPPEYKGYNNPEAW